MTDVKIAELEKRLADKKAKLRAAVSPERRYATQDATVEKLGELLQENPRGLLLARDELSGWLRTLDKPGREGDREFFLESWNGTGDYTFDRIGRGTVHVPAVTISVIGGIQPGKLATYMRDALEGGAGDDGLVQRIQLAVWPDRLGEWREADRWPNREARNQAFAVYEWLDSLDVDALGATRDDGEDGIPYLRFDQQAQAVSSEWRTDLEKRLRSDELDATPAFEAHLSKYRSLMPSLALLFHLVNIAAGGKPGSVREKPTLLAAAWCEYLEAHARKIWSAELSPGTKAARLLAKKIENGVIHDGNSVREIYRHEWDGLTSSEEVKAAVKVLAEANWVRLEYVEPAGDSGGRPSEVLRLHPDLRGKGDE